MIPEIDFKAARTTAWAKVAGTCEGSDYSHYNTPAFGADSFAFLKATQGKSFVDPEFAAWWELLKASGAESGAYHFLDGTTNGGPQARRFLDLVQPIEGLDALALDWEWFSPEANATIAANFVTTLRDLWSGAFCIYTVDTFLDKYRPLPSVILAEDIWYVEWGGHALPAGWPTWTFKQVGLWGSQAHDHDVFNGNSTALTSWWGNEGGDVAFGDSKDDLATIDMLRGMRAAMGALKSGKDARPGVAGHEQDGYDWAFEVGSLTGVEGPAGAKGPAGPAGPPGEPGPAPSGATFTYP